MAQWMSGPWQCFPQIYTPTAIPQQNMQFQTVPQQNMQFQTVPQHVMQVQTASLQPAQAQRTPQREQPACSFYGSQPGCRNGDRCAFRHVNAAPASRASTWPDESEKTDEYVRLTPKNRGPALKKRKKRATESVSVCRSFIIAGKTCERGNECPYDHPDTPKWPPNTCMFYVSGGACRNGDECKFQHPADTTQPTSDREIYRNTTATPHDNREGSNANRQMVGNRVHVQLAASPVTPDPVPEPAASRNAAQQNEQPAPRADSPSPTFTPSSPLSPELSDEPDDVRGGPPDDFPLELLQLRNKWTRDDMGGQEKSNHCWLPCRTAFPAEHIPSGVQCVYKHCRATWWGQEAPDQSLSCCWYCPQGREHFIHNECFEILKRNGREWYCPKCEPDNSGRRSIYTPYYDRLRLHHTPCEHKERLKQARYHDAPVSNRHPGNQPTRNKASRRSRRDGRNRRDGRSRRDGRDRRDSRDNRDRQPRSQQPRKVTVQRRNQ